MAILSSVIEVISTVRVASHNPTLSKNTAVMTAVGKWLVCARLTDARSRGPPAYCLYTPTGTRPPNDARGPDRYAGRRTIWGLWLQVDALPA